MTRLVAAGFGWLSGIFFGAWAAHQTTPAVGPNYSAAVGVLFAVAAVGTRFLEVAEVREGDDGA